MHGNRVPVYRVAVRELAREDTEEREHHSSARLQERQRGGAHVKGAPERVDVGWRARSTPTPPGRDVFRSRVRGQGCLPGGRSLRAQMIAKATIREGGGRKRIRQLLRGAQHAPQPGMIRCHSSTGGSTEVKGSVGVRPGGVQSIGDERSHTHFHWAALDTQTKVLQERYTHGESSQVRRGGHGRRKPGDTQREGVDQSAVEEKGGPVSASWRPGAQAGPSLHPTSSSAAASL
jgi:hypothetical protein